MPVTTVKVRTPIQADAQTLRLMASEIDSIVKRYKGHVIWEQGASAMKGTMAKVYALRFPTLFDAEFAVGWLLRSGFELEHAPKGFTPVEF